MYFSAVILMGKVPPHRDAFPTVSQATWRGFPTKLGKAMTSECLCFWGEVGHSKAEPRRCLLGSPHEWHVGCSCGEPSLRGYPVQGCLLVLQAYFSWKQEGVKKCQQQVTDHDTEQRPLGLRYTGERWSLCLFFAVVIALLYYTTYLAFALMWEQLSGRFLQHNSFPWGMISKGKSKI